MSETVFAVRPSTRANAIPRPTLRAPLGPVAVATLAISAAVALAPSGPAAPAEADAVGTTSGRLALSGGGSLRGVGNMLTYGVLTGRSRLIVVDRRGDAAITINGTARKGRRKKGSRIRILRTTITNGRIFVRGRGVTVKVRAPRLDLSVSGWGRVRVSGTGVYSLNGGNRRAWSTRSGKPRTIKVRARNGR